MKQDETMKRALREACRPMKIEALRRDEMARGNHDSANDYLNLACNKSDLIYRLETGEDIE